ncbi:hypothetical protein SEA_PAULODIABOLI_50 [Microbacterium phage PauloDiaboli]|nr:hypothetical protein SEA_PAULODIABOLI_50 [Microbacterium phage PauloDiaboli]
MHTGGVMADRMTSVRLRSSHPADGEGIAEYGRQTRQDMVQKYRAYAQRQFDRARAVLEAEDGDFIVETYTGHIVQRNREEVHDRAWI